MYATSRYSYVDLQNFLLSHEIYSKHGGKIIIDTLKRILVDPIYYGTMKMKGEFYQGVHKSIITKKLFDKVQTIITRKSKNYLSHKTDFHFLGLATCGECGSSITAEKHRKHYLHRNIDVDYHYYRCSKKKTPCHQSYLESSIFENQLRQIIFNASMSSFTAKKFLDWTSDDIKSETQNTSGEINTLNSANLETDSKLNNLLDGYIDKTIDPLDYQRKKNELIQYKVTTEEKIKEINTNGSSWLEPFTEFTKSALLAHKIARAKNNCTDLLIGAKTVGSNYFLLDKTIHPKFQNDGFLALANGAGVACATSKNFNYSLLSGILDSNQQPHAPHTCALANCANPRFTRRSFYEGRFFQTSLL